MTDREKLIDLIREGNGGYDFMSLERIADHLLANGVTVQEWISVKDRLPEDSGDVNLYTRSGIVGTGFYDKHTKKYYSVGAICVDVTHWQPLPQPPKGEQQ